MTPSVVVAGRPRLNRAAPDAYSALLRLAEESAAFAAAAGVAPVTLQLVKIRASQMNGWVAISINAFNRVSILSDFPVHGDRAV
jgi:hypothetical protein